MKRKLIIGEQIFAPPQPVPPEPSLAPSSAPTFSTRVCRCGHNAASHGSLNPPMSRCAFCTCRAFDDLTLITGSPPPIPDDMQPFGQHDFSVMPDFSQALADVYRATLIRQHAENIDRVVFDLPGLQPHVSRPSWLRDAPIVTWRRFLKWLRRPLSKLVIGVDPGGPDRIAYVITAHDADGQIVPLDDITATTRCVCGHQRQDHGDSHYHGQCTVALSQVLAGRPHECACQAFMRPPRTHLSPPSEPDPGRRLLPNRHERRRARRT